MRQTLDIRFDPIAGGGTHHGVTPSPCGAQFFLDARSFSAADQNFILDVTLELANCLLEVLVFTLFDSPLIDKHRLLHGIIER